MHPLFPCLSELDSGDALLRVLEDVGLQEVLEELFADEALHIVEELEAFLIGDRGEHIVRAVAFEDGVDARVGAVETISVHVLPERGVSE